MMMPTGDGFQRTPAVIRAEMARVAADLHAASARHDKAEMDEANVMELLDRVVIELGRTTERVNYCHRRWDALYDELRRVEQAETMVQA